MSLFLLTFFLIYGGAHAYALLKAKSALGFGWGTALAVTPLLLVLMWAPVLVYVFGRRDLDAAAHAASWIGYLWMGFLFFFIWTNLALDIVNIVTRTGGFLLRTGARPAIPYSRTAFFAISGLALLLGGYSLLEASRIGVEMVRISTDKLPQSTPRIRIAQISDVHLGMIVRGRTASAIAKIVRETAPDILVSTGDLVDARINHLEGLSGIFEAIRPPLGKFAITGNHEYYAGIGQALEFTRRAGFTLLRGESVTIGNVLRIAGVDDEAGAAYGEDEGLSETRALGGRSDLYTILLRHRPRIRGAARGLFDLQLSGHTHNGQIFPFRYVVGIPYPFLAGLYRLEDGSRLYVSRGTGTWGPPMRFLSTPIVTIIDIERGPGP